MPHVELLLHNLDKHSCGLKMAEEEDREKSNVATGRARVMRERRELEGVNWGNRGAKTGGR